MVRDGASQLKSSVLLIESDKDGIVDSTVYKYFIDDMSNASYVRHIIMKNAYHELLIETPTTFNLIMKEIEFHLNLHI